MKLADSPWRSSHVPPLLIATGNPGKERELRQLLEGVPFRLLSPRDLEVDVSGAEETGATFLENALIKARWAAAAAGIPALADDSGLEVDALDGRPGVQSARFGGAGLADGARNELLLTMLEGVPKEKRTARFKAAIAVVWPDGISGAPVSAEGTVEGWIGFAARGRGGFGYDPVFYLRGADGGFAQRSMAELTDGEKSALSHRGRAARRLRELLIRGGSPGVVK